MVSDKAWCIGCKDITYPEGITIEQDRSGYMIAKGVCPKCKTNTRRIMQKGEKAR